MRTPISASGFCGAYFSRIAISPGISFSAIGNFCLRPKDGHTDGVGELDFAARRQTGGDDILRHPASHVSRAAIDFARIFAGKRAAAVPAHAAIAVDDNLATGQAGVALRTADDETAGRIDQ
jgi:hypothetical protein